MEKKGGFWTSVPGVLTGIAAVVTALTGLFVAFRPDVSPSSSQTNSPATSSSAQVSAEAPAPASPTAQHLLRTPAKPAEWARPIDDLRQLVASQCGTAAEAIDLNVPLKTQRCDDLDLLEIVMAIEEKYKVKVPKSEFDLDRASINSLARIIHGR